MPLMFTIKQQRETGSVISKWLINYCVKKVRTPWSFLRLNKKVLPLTPSVKQPNIFFSAPQIICGWLIQDSSLLLSIYPSLVIALCLAEQSRCFIRRWHIHLSHSLWTDSKAREDSLSHTHTHIHTVQEVLLTLQYLWFYCILTLNQKDMDFCRCTRWTQSWGWNPECQSSNGATPTPNSRQIYKHQV